MYTASLSRRKALIQQTHWRVQAGGVNSIFGYSFLDIFFLETQQGLTNISQISAGMQKVMTSSIPVVKFWLTVTKVIRVEIWPKAVSLSDSPELTTSDLSRALKELSQEDFAEFRQYYAKIVCRLNNTQQTFQDATISILAICSQRHLLKLKFQFINIPIVHKIRPLF